MPANPTSFAILFIAANNQLQSPSAEDDVLSSAGRDQIAADEDEREQHQDEIERVHRQRTIMLRRQGNVQSIRRLYSRNFARGARDTAHSITLWLARCTATPLNPSAIAEQDGHPAVSSGPNMK